MRSASLKETEKYAFDSIVKLAGRFQSEVRPRPKGEQANWINPSLFPLPPQYFWRCYEWFDSLLKGVHDTIV